MINKNSILQVNINLKLYFYINKSDLKYNNILKT